MSASSTQFTFLVVIPTVRASNASCGPRPGLNPYEKPLKSASYTADNTATAERWTILSSNAGIPMGRCRPSGLGIQARLTGLAW
jgi:hypothetical protein